MNPQLFGIRTEIKEVVTGRRVNDPSPIGVYIVDLGGVSATRVAGAGRSMNAGRTDCLVRAGEVNLLATEQRVLIWEKTVSDFENSQIFFAWR